MLRERAEFGRPAAAEVVTADRHRRLEAIEVGCQRDAAGELHTSRVGVLDRWMPSPPPSKEV